MTKCIQNTVPLGPKILSPGIHFTIPLDPYYRPPDIGSLYFESRRMVKWIQGDSILDPRGTVFWIHLVTRSRHVLSNYVSYRYFWKVRPAQFLMISKLPQISCVYHFFAECPFKGTLNYWEPWRHGAKNIKTRLDIAGWIFTHSCGLRWLWAKFVS